MSRNGLKWGLCRFLVSVVACVVVTYSTHTRFTSPDVKGLDVKGLQATTSKGFANQELAPALPTADGAGHSDRPSLDRSSRGRRGGCSLVANRRTTGVID